MTELFRLCAGLMIAMLKFCAELQTEKLALRPQLCVRQRSVKRPKVRSADRVLWTFLVKTWTGGRTRSFSSSQIGSCFGSAEDSRSAGGNRLNQVSQAALQAPKRLKN